MHAHVCMGVQLDVRARGHKNHAVAHKYSKTTTSIQHTAISTRSACCSSNCRLGDMHVCVIHRALSRMTYFNAIIVTNDILECVIYMPFS